MSSPTISLRIDDEQKERWEQALENEPRVQNLSDFIRLSVEDYIDRNDLVTDDDE
ncbi:MULTISPECIES: hypothetical protein [Haloarculaceae]|uniref:hypothetical protein n=1 Tax=Haloarculaceae TaxID=1963268 RepID=UPI0012983136|nr:MULTISPECIES: hypothetical protein [Haloarculaceae]QGA82112.1 hypothetical protein LC1Hm_1052 [Halomicrobium sp. LC1Hm]